jgi:hypothetical protein
MWILSKKIEKIKPHYHSSQIKKHEEGRNRGAYQSTKGN